MKKLMAVLLAAAAMTNVQAASVKEQATETVLKALRCELPRGKYKTVLKALKTIGAKNMSTKMSITNEHSLPVPLDVFGMTVTTMFLDDDNMDFYSFEGKGAKIDAAGAAAKADDGAFERVSKIGTLTLKPGQAGAVSVLCATQGD